MQNPPPLNLSVIIPFKDKAKMTLDCVQSFEKYGPHVKEILLVSNDSLTSEIDMLQNGIKNLEYVKIIIYNKPFNYQKMNNWAVKQALSKFILFLNNDIELEASSTKLITEMYKKAHQPNVGLTGCLLLYGDKRTIQHAGVYLLPRGQADHLYVAHTLSQVISKSRDNNVFPYDITKDLPMTAVTGAAQLVETKKFNEVGGFDERFIICGGDVDLCIRLNEKHYQTWFVAGGFMIHKESQSRINKPIPYTDFYWSYLSYMKAFDYNLGDKFLPLITNKS